MASALGSASVKGGPPIDGGYGTHVDASLGGPQFAGDPSRPRVYAKTRHVWVKYEPTFEAGWVGFLWFGGAAILKDPNPIKSNDKCPAWYALEPYGYVCVDGVNATLDADDPVFKAISPYAPKVDSPWPHRYGESRDYQRYKELPSEAVQRRREWDHDEHVKRLAEAAAGGKVHEKAAGVDQTPSEPGNVFLPELPPTLREERSRLVIGSTSTWSADFEKDGRSWLLGADLMYFPKDRVAPYPVSNFHGVHLTDGVRLPLAYFRKKARPKYTLAGTGEMVANGETWERQSWVQLTGKSQTVAGVKYLETVEPNVFAAASDATVPTPQEKTPWGATVGEPDTTGKAPKGRGTWIEVSITGGWMIDFEGTTPVMVTLIAPGRGGPPLRGVDPLKTASTPTGAWPVTGKFATAMMVAPEDLIHSDVPWAQNFHGPHALHGAYWHGDWGEWKSAGCINLSPIDGRWLFHWTEPAIPEGWHGIRWDEKLGPATWLIVHD